MNFLSYADLSVDCYASLILRRKAFFLIILEYFIFCLKTSSMYIKRVVVHLQALKNTPQNQKMGKITFFLFSRCKVRVYRIVYKIIFYFVKIFLYNKI